MGQQITELLGHMVSGLGDMIESPAHLKDTPTKDKVRRIWLCRKDPQGIEITDVA